MNKNQLKFLNDILKPWDELNNFLMNPYCVSPELSDITRNAISIAINLSHFAENSGLCKRKETSDDLIENTILIDIADMSKHSQLRDQRRENNIVVSSMFQCHDNKQFRFLRNVINVNHNTHGKTDFMEISLIAIRYWVEKLELAIDREILYSNGEFYEKAKLIFNPQYCIQVKNTQYLFVKEVENSRYVPFHPAGFYIEINDLHGEVLAFADVVNN